jgi:hypothetical protein
MIEKHPASTIAWASSIELLGAVGGLPLGAEAAELRHAHRRDADVTLDRDA